MSITELLLDAEGWPVQLSSQTRKKEERNRTQKSPNVQIYQRIKNLPLSPLEKDVSLHTQKKNLKQDMKSITPLTRQNSAH